MEDMNIISSNAQKYLREEQLPDEVIPNYLITVGLNAKWYRLCPSNI